MTTDQVIIGLAVLAAGFLALLVLAEVIVHFTLSRRLRRKRDVLYAEIAALDEEADCIETEIRYAQEELDMLNQVRYERT